MNDCMAEYAQRIIDGLEPHEDAGIARMLEDAIEQRNLHHEYSIMLVSIVCESWHLHGWRSWEDSWALIRATPEQRARAFLQAVA